MRFSVRRLVIEIVLIATGLLSSSLATQAQNCDFPPNSFSAYQMAPPAPPKPLFLSELTYQPIISTTSRTAASDDNPSVVLGKGRIFESGETQEIKESEEIDASVQARQFLEQGRYEEAERSYRSLLVELEAQPVKNSSQIASTLSNLALLFHVQARFIEAAEFYQKAIEATPRNYLLISQYANVLYAQGQIDDAEAEHKAALQIVEADLATLTPLEREPCNQVTAKKELDLGLVANNFAQFLFLAKQDYGKAEDLYQKALDRFIRVRRTQNHPDVALAYNNLALVNEAQGKNLEAESLFLKSYQSFQNAGLAERPDAVMVLRNLAVLYSGQQKWDQAFERYEQAAVAFAKRMRNRQRPGNTSPLTVARNELAWNRSLFEGLVVAAKQLATTDRDRAQELSERAYQASQWSGQTLASTSLLQMAARQAKGRAEVAEMVRERQDLTAEAEGLEHDLDSVLAGGSTRLRDSGSNDSGREDYQARLTDTESRISALDLSISERFPEYFTLVGPEPITLKESQNLLQDNEALIVLQPTSAKGFGWLITRDQIKWFDVPLALATLADDVAALRCGLDYEASWTDLHCYDLLKVTYTALDQIKGKPLPFDLARAHELYKGLFGEIEGPIKGKRLMIVPSGPLTQLPFQVLVTEPPNIAIPDSFTNYRNVAWVARKHAITVLPAVSSLKALRELAQESHASEPYVGFGDPLLDGDPTKFKDDAAAAKLAREKRCDPTLRQGVASLLGLRGGSRTVSRSKGGAVDVADLRTWAPLPETADELCDVAHDLGVDPATNVYLGASATETKIKQLSESGALAKNKIVHFATHGAVAGEISSASEPGLLLTPPDKASEIDDGYLSASEIADLKLDADWVILSACNTAAGDAKGAEALSGLARAFFYAGARSLLVSHWEVASDPTVKLITKAVDELKRNPKIGRAEALRRSMLSMIETGKNYEAHPAFWAPFVLVGEGGAAR